MSILQPSRGPDPSGEHGTWYVCHTFWQCFPLLKALASGGLSVDEKKKTN
jgi:hypothetical protein